MNYEKMFERAREKPKATYVRTDRSGRLMDQAIKASQKLEEDLTMPWSYYSKELVDLINKKENKNMIKISSEELTKDLYDAYVVVGGRPHPLINFTIDGFHGRIDASFAMGPYVENPKVNCPPPGCFDIHKVTFNGPKTIVEWKDGAKTIVNCNDESYDPEKGLAMAIVKKVFGNKGNYYNTFRKAMDGARYYNQPEEHYLERLGEVFLATMLAGLKNKVEGEKSDE